MTKGYFEGKIQSCKANLLIDKMGQSHLYNQKQQFNIEKA